MTRVSKTIGVLAMATFGVAGCASDQGGQPVVTNQAIGAALGGIAGGYAGSRFGQGSGKTAAVIAGSLVGAGLGAALAQRLSEQGRVAYARTEQQALSQAPTNQPVQWRDPQSDIYGTVTPTSDPYYRPIAGQAYVDTGTYAPYDQTYAQYDQTYAQPGYGQPQVYGTSNRAECRDYETSVVSGGQIEKAVGTMCRNSPNEPWRLQN